MVDYAKLFQLLVPIIEQILMVLEQHSAGTAVNRAMVPVVASLKTRFAALADEIGHMEGGADGHGDRLAALERSVSSLHAALSETPAPAGVQKAVENVEVPHVE